VLEALTLIDFAGLFVHQPPTTLQALPFSDALAMMYPSRYLVWWGKKLRVLEVRLTGNASTVRDSIGQGGGG
jgi:hypothetical protein